MKAYRTVETQITDGGRDEVLEALDHRERELAGEPLTTDAPATAIADGGTVAEPEEDPEPTAEHESPYLLRALDERENERTDEPLPLETSEIQSRLGLETETCDVSEINVRSPREAATLGGGQ